MNGTGKDTVTYNESQEYRIVNYKCFCYFNACSLVTNDARRR